MSGGLVPVPKPSRSLPPRAAAQYRHHLAPFPGREAARRLVDMLAFDHPANDGETGGRDRCRIHSVFEKCGMGHRDPTRERLQHHLGIGADLVLRVGIGAQ